MNDTMRRRVLYQAQIMLDESLTVRQVAKLIGLSKSTIHKDLTEKLKLIDLDLYSEVAKLLEYNKNVRHIRGGQKTKERYEQLMKLHGNID